MLIEHDKIVNKDRLAAINKVADERISRYSASPTSSTHGSFFLLLLEGLALL